MFGKRRRPKLKTSNPYVEPIGHTSPTHELYRAMPRLQQLAAKQHLTEDDQEFLNAINLYADYSNRMVLCGLQSLCEVLHNAACQDGFYVTNEQLLNCANLLNMNLSFVQENIEIERVAMQTGCVQKPRTDD